MARKRAKLTESFTLEEANAMLPLVRAIVGDLVKLSCEVTDRRRRLSFLMAGRNPNDHDLYHDELVQVEEVLDQDGHRIQEYVEELRALGLKATDGLQGLVDFPAEIEGRKIHLCWKLGEPEVICWHDPSTGCSQRKSLAVDSWAGGADDSTSEETIS